MDYLRDGIDDDGKSVVTISRSVASAVGRARAVTGAGSGEGGDDGRSGRKGYEAYTFALASFGSGNQIASEAVAMFLDAVSSRYGAQASNLRYCFAVAMFNEIANAKTNNRARGELARQLMMYPVMAFHHMNKVTMDMEPMKRVQQLIEVLDESLPVASPPRHFSGKEGSITGSLIAARCAIPFAFGLAKLVPADRLDFVMKAIINGEMKSVRYFMSYIMEQDDTFDAERGAAAAGNGAAAAGEGDGDDEVRPSQPKLMKPELTSDELKAIVARIPASHAFTLLHALGFHEPPYDAHTDPALQRRISQYEPIIPPCRGSILRAYARSVADLNVDNDEPEIQTFSDCVV